MFKRFGLIGVAIICVAGPGCEKKPATDAAQRQVVATLDGEPITATELKDEAGKIQSATPLTPQALNQVALSRIIDRRLMAKAAVDQKLDTTPEYALESRRVLEALKAEALAHKLVVAQKPPTPEQVTQYVIDHPEAFADRKLFFVDRVLLTQPKTPFEETKGIRTLDELQAALDKQKYPYRRSHAVVDSATARPEVVARLRQLSPNQLVTVTNGDAVSVNTVTEVRSAPVTGDAANQAATGLLKAKAANDAVAGQVAVLREAAKTKIHYSPGYEPKADAATTAAPKPG